MPFKPQPFKTHRPGIILPPSLRLHFLSHWRVLNPHTLEEVRQTDDAEESMLWQGFGYRVQRACTIQPIAAQA